MAEEDSSGMAPMDNEARDGNGHDVERAVDEASEERPGVDELEAPVDAADNTRRGSTGEAGRDDNVKLDSGRASVPIDEPRDELRSGGLGGADWSRRGEAKAKLIGKEVGLLGCVPLDSLCSPSPPFTSLSRRLSTSSLLPDCCSSCCRCSISSPAPHSHLSPWSVTSWHEKRSSVCSAWQQRTERNMSSSKCFEYDRLRMRRELS